MGACLNIEENNDLPQEPRDEVLDGEREPQFQKVQREDVVCDAMREFNGGREEMRGAETHEVFEVVSPAQADANFFTSCFKHKFESYNHDDHPT